VETRNIESSATLECRLSTMALSIVGADQRCGTY
jgi:hypothetical protein